MKPGRGPCAPFSRPPGCPVSVSGRTLTLGSPLHRKELNHHLGVCSGTCRAVTEPRACRRVPTSVHVGCVYARALRPQLSKGALAFNLATPPLHTRPDHSPPRGEEVTEPPGAARLVWGRGLGPVVCTLRPVGQRLDGGRAGLAVTGVPSPHRLEAEIPPPSLCVPPPLNLEWVRSRGSKSPEIRDSFTGGGFLSTLPYCVPLTCAGVASELCALAPSLTSVMRCPAGERLGEGTGPARQRLPGDSLPLVPRPGTTVSSPGASSFCPVPFKPAHTDTAVPLIILISPLWAVLVTSCWDPPGQGMALGLVCCFQKMPLFTPLRNNVGG